MNTNQQRVQKNSANSENIRIYISLKRDSNEELIENRKLILMTPSNIKISMLKRIVEQEFSDLFPNEPTFICAKIQDEYGYSLSNSSYIFELVKNNDRLIAIPEKIGSDMGTFIFIKKYVTEYMFQIDIIQFQYY
ncbi:hypothetical protein IMG5_203810 [Ichthyophthirius multifiliis]|uniref:Nucleolar protein Dnt1-like N-terminal domain-containing protein n=1 Tax=Ichthyophthirius multifiliis TaxID=5932 RepID=G0R6B9_ICHMU|nr:hypothetical protein IMG5_203810 [Ichthyophthirius multifiliis]EGR26982.1 hypothetical protein IMG5_203810 [Ichthyophthirius multifiliis]|eukprot:XP_004023866.1 hypothetical protein IMG5_203810 [Ichthyophthirius multifiliis]